MILSVDPEHPHERHLHQIVEVLQRDGVIVYPTDTAYGLACSVESPKGIHRLEAIKNGGQKRSKKLFTLVAPSLGVASRFAEVEDRIFPLIRDHVPGPYTFILNAYKLTPRKVQGHRKTIGVRIPDHPFVSALLSELGVPLVSISAPHPEGTESDPLTIAPLVGRGVDLIVDAGVLPRLVSSVIDLTGPAPVILREGLGPLDDFR
ncbi:MAG: threonylcarbamoyl-AMP synthase [Deltaproteobacteria bacterium]|nr:MAG: threonylcarbamoyl-AMP synthase [Deltaproteobacteria bacterium]